MPDYSLLSLAPPEQVPGLLQIAQTPIDLPTNSTPEGEQAAQEYARFLQQARQMQYASRNPQFQPDDNTQQLLATTGARYAGTNNITYEPGLGPFDGGGSGFSMDGQGGAAPQDGGAGTQGGGGGFGFYMGGKPVAMPQVQGDAGRQLGRLPPDMRDAYGPSVVQHILRGAGQMGGGGNAYPGSLRYMTPVPPFGPAENYHLSRDAWGRGFGIGSMDTTFPQQPRP